MDSAFTTYRAKPDGGYDGIKEAQVNKIAYTQEDNAQGGVSVYIGKEETQ